MAHIQHSELSHKITKALSSKTKKDEGIYFTSLATIKRALELLNGYLDKITTILEPSCGSCEFITQLAKTSPHFNITGIEKNTQIYNEIKGTYQEYNIINGDYLSCTLTMLYDLIITNPPYFVLKKTKALNEYNAYYDGRPNIFILFLVKSLKMLNKNGILCFVLPKNFLSCLYYDKTRKYINDNFTILHIEECNNDYIDTSQETILLIIQNKSPVNNNTFVLKLNNNVIFGFPENIEKIQPLIQDASTTLSDLGFTVSVGPLVWNQHKEILTHDQTKTRLIYSSDIVNNKLTMKEYKNEEKKNYIDKPGITDILLVINRGYGKGEYNFNYCLINIDTPYLIENHLICIKYSSTPKLSKEQLIEKYNTIIESLKNKKTKQFIKLYFTNNAINTTELSNILPIYL
jgi:adenine-specific DNA-methyltransferase